MRKPNKPNVEHAQSFDLIPVLTGWAQKGMESLFTTQRALADMAMRQNASMLKTLQEGVSHPEHSPLSLLTELAVEGTSSFIESQRILLDLVQKENEILMNGVKERTAGNTRAGAMTDLVRRSLDNFLTMQQDFLTTTSKQTMQWLDAVKAGKGYQSTHLLELARESMDTFVHAQKAFLDVVAEETARAATGKPEQHPKTTKKTELKKLAREATDALIEAQRKLLDVAGQQMNVNLNTATKTMELVSPARLWPMANLTGERVKNFVEAEKSLIASVIKPRNGTKTTRGPKPHRKHVVHHRKAAKPMAHATA